MKGIVKRSGSYSWNVTYKGQRRTGTALTAVQAETARQEALDFMKAGKDIKKERANAVYWTLGEAFDYTKKTEWHEAKSAKQLVGIGKAVVGYFGKDTKLEDITFEQWDAYVDHMVSQGKANGTINRHRSALSKLFSTAHSRGKGPTKPHLRTMKEGQGRDRYFTLSEEKAILDLALMWGQQELYNFMVVSCDTGFRSSELLSMTMNEYQPKGKRGKKATLYLADSKVSKPRLIHLTERADACFVSQSNQNRLDCEPVFSIKQRKINALFDRIRTHLNLGEEVVPYTFRHTFASRLAISGVPIERIMKLMGHTNIQMTMRYAHLSPKTLEEAIDTLEEYRE